MRKVSIRDVAREAGVSIATVSYVLNRISTQTISEDTQQKVRAAAARLGYVPNLNARSLTSRRTNLIGVVIPQTEPGREFMFDNPFYGALLSSLEYTARTNGYHLLLTGPRSGQSYIGIARHRGLRTGVALDHVGDLQLASLDLPDNVFDGIAPAAFALRADALPGFFPLRPRDIVYVDVAAIARWNRVVSNILPTSQMLNLLGDTRYPLFSLSLIHISEPTRPY